MTVKLKKSWFEKNEKPLKFKRLIKKFTGKQYDIIRLYHQMIKYKIPVPDEVLYDLLYKAKIYSYQVRKIERYIIYMEKKDEASLHNFNYWFSKEQYLPEEMDYFIKETKKSRFFWF